MGVQLFSINHNVVIRRPGSGNLESFLLKNTGRQVFKGKIPLRHGFILPLHITSATGEKAKPVCLPRTLAKEGATHIWVAVREDERGKVLYTWKNEADWGNGTKSFTEHVLARKIDGNWHILIKAEIIKGQTAVGQRKAEAKQIAELLSRPEINIPATFWQKTVQRKGETCLRVSINGLRRYLFGFNGHNEVMVVTVKLRNGDTRLSIYGPGQGLIKQVVFLDDPKAKTKIIYSTADHGTQHDQLQARQVWEFLTTNRPQNFLDLAPKVVSPAGAVKLYTGESGNGYEGFLSFSGYRKYVGKKLYGRLVVCGREKKIFFWRDPEERLAGATPVRAGGQIVTRQTDGQNAWEIIWRAGGAKRREEIDQTKKFGNFVFSLKSEGAHAETLPLQIFPSGRALFKRRVRGQVFQFTLRQVQKSAIFAVTQKVGRSDVHLVELWENKTRQDKPLAVFWLAVKRGKEKCELRQFELLDLETLASYLHLSFEKKVLLLSHPALYPHRPLLAKYF